MSRPKSSVNRPEGGASGPESNGRWSSGVRAGGEEQQWRISGGRCEQAVGVSWHLVREPAVGVSRPESGMSRLEGGMSRGPVDEGAVVAKQWQVEQCRTRDSSM